MFSSSLSSDPHLRRTHFLCVWLNVTPQCLWDFISKTEKDLSNSYIQLNLIMLKNTYACFLRSLIFIELKLNITHYFLNVLTDPIILSVHFTNRMWCFEYASGFSSLYNVLFSAAKACQGDLCGWLIFSGVYSSTMKICKTEEPGGMSYIQI